MRAGTAFDAAGGTDAPARRRFTVAGQVQGVGFRPFVFRLAEEHGLTGFTRNAPEGVVIEVQGRAARVDGFGRDLVSRLPPLARIVSCAALDLPLVPGEEGFAIRKSSAGEGHQVLISPDAAVCPDCLREFFDPADPRHLYPFINCTNCGPRYTITRSIPYDRDKTSMACFPMCARCAGEYGDARDRRFHAQPNACPVCGPRVWLTDRHGRELAGGDEAVAAAAARLAAGDLAAVKGLGGFHLACDATDPAAVRELRRRKRRPGKPLAVMVPDLETARLLAEVGPEEAAMLAGRQRPIALLRKRPETDALLAGETAPDTEFIGVMLPYAPLQHALFWHLGRAVAAAEPARRDRPSALVMTSGNLSDEPIALGNREALARLADVADLFLLHDRDILIRVDDSVVRFNPELGDFQFLRRARGFTPAPIFLAAGGPSVIGCGPELKNTLCFTKGDQAFVSQHVGDLRNLETLGFYREIAAHLEAILQVRPEAVVRDLHPDYLSTGEAQAWAEERGLPLFGLQHHYAHAYAVLAERKHDGPALALALDGTGYGEDGTIWGGECLFVNGLERRRLGHLDPVLLPGGEAAAREPWRMARSCLFALGIEEPAGKVWPWLREGREPVEAGGAQADAFLGRMLGRKINCPVTTSCGRLFDAVAGMLGLCLEIGYEGQAAILLEKVQDRRETGAYPCPVRPALPGGSGGSGRATGDDVLRAESEPAAPLVLGTLDLFRAAYLDWQADVPAGIISRRFHLGLAAGLAELAKRAAEATGARTVGLSGGVMQNLTLAMELPRALKAVGLTPLSHLEVPPNDACVSLGQAAWGRLALAAWREARTTGST